MKTNRARRLAESLVLPILCGIIVLWGLQAFGDENFSVAGEVYFHEEGGVIIVWLKTFDEYENKREPSDPARSLVIAPTQEQLSVKKVSFNFDNVPKGVYCITSMQDFNNNRKVDHSAESGAPIEPYGFSGPSFFGPALWEDIKLDVDKNISGIQIKY